MGQDSSKFQGYTDTVCQVAPGKYKIQSMGDSTLALDFIAESVTLSRVIVAHSFPCEHQEWIIEHLGEGCSIKNACTGLYLTVQHGIKNDASIVATPNPVSWHIRSTGQENTFKITWPNSQYVFDLHKKVVAPGSRVNLYTVYIGDCMNQSWKFEPIKVDEEDSYVNDETKCPPYGGPNKRTYTAEQSTE